METVNLWDFLEQEPKYAKETKALFEWSLNYDYKKRPFVLFLDIIGYNMEHYGQQFYEGESMGYLEASYLGDALKEWADSPHEVEAWVTELMATEG